MLTELPLGMHERSWCPASSRCRGRIARSSNHRRNQLGAKLIALALGCLVAIPAATRGDTPEAPLGDKPAVPQSGTPEVLSVVPANAWAVLTLRDLAGLNTKITKEMARLELPPVNPFLLAKGSLEIVEGINEKGTAALAVMPPSPLTTTPLNLVLFVPTSDRDKLLAFVGPKPVEDGYQKVTLKGKETFVGTKGGYTVFGADLETVKSIVAAKSGIGSKFCEHQLRRFAVNDASLHVNVAQLSSEPSFIMLATMLSQATGGSIGALKDYKTWQLSLRLDPEGLALEVYSERTTAGPQKPIWGTKRELLAGLPGEPFVLAMGMSEGEGRGSARLVEKTLDQVSKIGAIDPSRRKELEEAIGPLSEGVVQTGAVLSALTPGPDGLIGFAKVVETKGPAREMLDKLAPLLELLKSGVVIEPQAVATLNRLEYRRSAETLGNVLIDHLVVDLAGLEATDEELLRKVVGEEGILIRIGAVDDKHTVATFGGGLARFEAVAETVRSGAAALRSHPGITKASSKMPAERSLEVYFALDRFATLVRDVLGVLDEPSPLPAMPGGDVPVSIVIYPVGAAGEQVDVFVPSGVICEIKTLAMDKMARAISPGAMLPSP